MLGLSDCYEPAAAPELQTERPPSRFRALRVLCRAPLVVAAGRTVVHASAALLPHNRQRAELECVVEYAGSVLEGARRADEAYLSARVRDSLEPTLLMDAYAKNTVRVSVAVLQSGGGDQAVATLAASLVCPLRRRRCMAKVRRRACSRGWRPGAC